MKMIWKAMSDSTHIPIKVYELPEGFLKLLAENEIDYGWAFQNYHALDLTDLKYSLHVVRINAGNLDTDLRRKIKAITFEIENFIEECEAGRYGVIAEAVEEENEEETNVIAKKDDEKENTEIEEADTTSETNTTTDGR